MSRSDLEAQLSAEVLRVLGEGPADETHFYRLRIDAAATDAQLADALARLRELPSGIGLAELQRRVGTADET